MKWHCWIKWRTWLTVAVVVVYSILLLVFLPLMIFGLYAVHAEIQFSAWFVSAVFVLLTIPIFLANLLQHLYNYTKPQLQAYIVRILWIVPVYSIDSWFGLKFPSTAIYWSTVRECYESYALYNFLIYLLNFLEEEYVLSEIMATRPPVIHPVPFCCCKPWPTGRRFIRWCKVAVLQYAVIRPILTVIALICQLAGVYDEGHIRPDKAFVYIAAANGISQGLALYGLVYFYKGMKDLLKPLNPVLKFGAIKAIIFFTFWQALIISFLVKINVIQQSVAWKKYGFEDVANSIQDFIICVEMLIAAIGFYFIFSHKPYVDPAAAQIPCLSSFLSMVDVRDIYGDVKENFVDPLPVPRLPRRIQARNRHMESAPLIGNESDNISGYESGGERGMQGERLGSGEASLIILSMSQERERVRVEHVREKEEKEEEDDDDCIIHQDSDQEGALIRERRNNSSLEHSDS